MEYVMSAPSTEELPMRAVREPDVESDPEIEEIFREMQRLVFKHPIVSQAIISAFAAEGRRFACTPEGQVWLARLAGSDLHRKGRELFYLGTFGMFSERDPGVLPSAMVDGFVRAVKSGDLAAMLSLLTGRPRR